MKKIIFNLIVIISIYAFISLNLSPASGQLTFQVPVELKNIHADLKYWRVNIEVYCIVPNEGHALVGIGNSRLFEINRNYNGMITVIVRCNDVSKAENYIFKLQIKNPENMQWSDADEVLKSNPKYNVDPSKVYKWRVDKRQ